MYMNRTLALLVAVGHHGRAACIWTWTRPCPPWPRGGGPLLVFVYQVAWKYGLISFLAFFPNCLAAFSGDLVAKGEDELNTLEIQEYVMKKMNLDTLKVASFVINEDKIKGGVIEAPATADTWWCNDGFDWRSE